MVYCYPAAISNQPQHPIFRITPPAAEAGSLRFMISPPHLRLRRRFRLLLD
jgi:hypothetical protein